MLISQILAAHFLGNSFANVILQVGFGGAEGGECSWDGAGRTLASEGTRKLSSPPPPTLWLWRCFVFPLEMKRQKTSETNMRMEWEEREILKSWSS